MLHDRKSSLSVRLRFDGLCPGQGTVETGHPERAGERLTGAGTAVLRLRAGKQPYRVRCAGDRAKGNPRASGVLSLVRDSGEVPLPARVGANVIEADGRRYTILYQSRPPALTLGWQAAPAGVKDLEVHVQSPSGTRTLPAKDARHRLASGALAEGIHTWWYATKDGRESPTNDDRAALRQHRADGAIFQGGARRRPCRRRRGRRGDGPGGGGERGRQAHRCRRARPLSRRAGAARRRQRRGRAARAGSRPRALLHSPARRVEMKLLARRCSQGHHRGVAGCPGGERLRQAGLRSACAAGRWAARNRRGDERGRRAGSLAPVVGGLGRGRRSAQARAAQQVRAARWRTGAAGAGQPWQRCRRGRCRRGRRSRRAGAGGVGGTGGAPEPEALSSVIPVATPDTRISSVTRSWTGRPHAPRVRAAGFAWLASTTRRKIPG